MSAASEDALIGQTLVEKYQILRQIGRGGMGVVYEAEHVDLGKRVAIKLMLEKYLEDGEATTRFKREALAASRIGNPHIIDISDIGTAPDGRMFVVMELLRGSSLADLIKRSGPIPPQRCLEIIRQTLRAVGAAHAKNIVHRDLKPDNIFLVATDEDRDFVKLLDFGISKVVGPAEIAATKLTSTGAVVGTPLYMAPEQAMGEETDQRADVYALGVILYEMLTGRPPFEATTYPALVMKLLTADPPLVSDIRPGIPSNIVAAVHRALEKQPSARFASCDAFAAALGFERGRMSTPPPSASASAAAASNSLALDQTMNSGEVSVLTPSRLPQAQPQTSPGTNPTLDARPAKKLPVVAIGLGVALVGAIAAVVVLMNRKAETAATPAPQPTVQPIAVATPDAALAAVEAPDASTAAIAPPTPPAKPAKTVDKKQAIAPPLPTKGSNAPIQQTPSPHDDDDDDDDPKTVKTPAPTNGVTAEQVHKAILRHDGKGCLSLLGQLQDPAPGSYQYRSLHATCQMVAGNCDKGLEEQKELYRGDGTPESSAELIVDIYCPPGNDPATRLKRIVKQTSMFSNFDCDYYIGPARASARDATTDRDKQIVGSVLASIATCYSRRGDCPTAHKVLGEAQVFIPALKTNELSAKCR